MKREIFLNGRIFGIRPVELSDAQFIVDLRSDPARSKYLHSISPDVDSQIDYLRANMEKDNDYYFIVKKVSRDENHGTIALYNLCNHLREAEFGRWILRKGSLAAAESAFLLYRLAFDVLGLECVYTRTIAENKSVISFHESCGLKKFSLLHAHFCINARYYDAIEQRAYLHEWSTIKANLEDKVRLLSLMVDR